METGMGEGVSGRASCEDPRLVPSATIADGLEALELLMRGARSVSAAVAFVTCDGARLLVELLRAHGIEEADLVARGAPITDPDALVLLRDAGVGVSVVMGPEALRFHPKLWLARRNRALRVLSGSGNLTQGGLRGNREQFELLELAVPSAAARAQEDRLARLVTGARSLDEVEGGAAWRTWRDQLKRRRPLLAQLERFDAQLAATVPADRTDDKRVLQRDLELLYRQTVDAGLRRRDGQHYIPHRFREGVEQAARTGDPVTLVGRICHRRTEGFDVILAHDRPDLTVEALVVDARKPYHSLFGAETKRRSEERLRSFPSWDRYPSLGGVT